jgi:hypothetical protein
MTRVTLIWGILACVATAIGYTSLVGSWYWLAMTFAGIGILLCLAVVAIQKGERIMGAVIGGLLNFVAIFVGLIHILKDGAVI